MDGEYDDGAQGPANPVVRRLAGVDGALAAPKAQTKSPWLEAWNDPVAGVSAYSPCIHTCNLYGDGDWRLVLADSDRKLKVWKGTQKQSEHALLDTPVAISSFISDNAAPRLPALAVAAGAHIFIYRNLRPYYKFVLPPEDVNTEEQECWQKVMAGDIVVGDALTTLTRLQDAGVVLTNRSLQLMNIGDPEKKLTFIEQWQGQPLVATSTITCMDAIKLAIDEPDAVSCLLVGTESGRILILNPAGTTVSKNIWLGVTPAFIAVQGEIEVSYRITVAARDGKIYSIRNGEVQPTIIQLEAAAVGLVHGPRGSVVVGCMNDTLHCYQPNARKEYSVYLPAPILAIQKLELSAAKTYKGVLVALRNGEVRVYNDKSLVSVHTLPSPVTGMWFGRYGREENTLITITKSGMLDIRVLPRAAALDAPQGEPGPPSEQDIPLQVPKKTRLYVEQTQREREQASDMHRAFQRDLARMRLTTARAYVKILTDGQGATAFTASSSLTLTLSSKGLGPHFRLVITVRNDSASHIYNVPVALSAPEHLYRLGTRVLTLPFLAPSVSYVYEVPIECVDPSAGSDLVTVVVMNRGSSLPVLRAQLKMPVSELEDQ